MSESVQKPRIRFKGFSDAWEQRKLGEAGTTFTGLSGKTKEDFGHGNAGFVTYMNVFSNPIADLTQYEKVELDSKQAQVKYGDVFFTTSSETPEEVGMSSIWLGKQPNIYLNSFCFGYRPSISTNPYYLGFMLRSASVRKKFILLAQGISRYNISKNKAMEIVVSIPSESEQENVGTFFKEIDNLITLHQCKDFSLKSVFEESKNFISALRKNTSWEQRKFVDLYNYASEGGTPDTNNSSFYENGDVPFVKIEDTENKYIDSAKSYITQEGLSHSSAWLIPENSVIFTNGATVGNVAINRLPVATKQGILGIIPSKKVVTEFLFYLLSSSTFQREVRSRMATGTFATIILKNLNQIPVCIPSDKSEQEEIAGYLSAFDNLITLHQRIKINITGDYHDKKDK